MSATAFRPRGRVRPFPCSASDDASDEVHRSTSPVGGGSDHTASPSGPPARRSPAPEPSAPRAALRRAPSDTFSDLWVESRLDLTVEAVILTEREWDSIFEDSDREAARQRLRDHEWPPVLAMT